jgi:peroxiredoxin Q/BCP
MHTLLTFALSTALCTLAADLSVGDAAPSFSAAADDGSIWKSADHVGKKIIVLYFYPADMTGGCTKQACAFRDDQDALASKDVVVLGVSGDSVRNHTLFKKVHTLNFPLLADEDGAVAKAFGVPLRKGGSIERTIDGKLETLTRGVSAARWTFVIGKDGKIAHKKTKVNAAKDSASILAVVDSLK